MAKLTKVRFTTVLTPFLLANSGKNVNVEKYYYIVTLAYDICDFVFTEKINLT